MVAAFKDRSPIAIIWLVLLSIFIHSHFIFDFPGVEISRQDGLFSLILKDYINGLNPVFVVCLYHSVILIQALRLNYLFSENRMYSKPNYLAAMVYLLLTGIFVEWNTLSPALLDNFLIIWLYAKTNKLYNTPNPKTLIFNIGLIIPSVLLLHCC